MKCNKYKFIWLFVILFSFGAAAEEATKCKDGVGKIPLIIGNAVLENAIDSKPIDSYIIECHEKSLDMTHSQRNDFSEVITSSLTLIKKSASSITIEKFIDPSKQADLAKKQLELNKIEARLQVVAISIASNSSLDNGWKQEFSANFYMGFEGSSVDEIKNKVTGRTGFMVYNQISGVLSDDRSKDKIKLNPWASSIGEVHVFGNVLLTSSGEESSINNNEVKQATRIDANYFFPFGTKMQSNGLFAIGPIFSHGLRKSDNDGDFTRLRYFGIRFAHGAESFLDVLEGGSSNTSNRIFIRGQVPATEAFDGRIFVGGELNIASKKNSVGSDSFSIYVTWQVEFSDVFGN